MGTFQPSAGGWTHLTRWSDRKRCRAALLRELPRCLAVGSEKVWPSRNSPSGNLDTVANNQVMLCIILLVVTHITCLSSTDTIYRSEEFNVK